ncbi:MAG: AmmeMemoRadiSam system protein A [Candidatus Scalinduaceae bacterium]
MDEREKKLLLQIARKSIESTIKGVPFTETQVQLNCQELEKEFGAFVTLKTHGKLRGCIGRMVSDIPLYKLVSEMAISAAIEDPRFQFNRIQPSELDDLVIEISVLSPLQRIENPLDLELGKHGIYIIKGFRNGCFLPQVATETGWTKEEFLSQCCHTKAGLLPDAWKEKDTEVYVFTVEIVSEAIAKI